jgi:capsular exopolysaccharide synthesis family protein
VVRPSEEHAVDGERHELQALLRVLRRRIGLILLCAVVTPLAAFVYSQLSEKTYEATASLLFRDPGFDQKLFGASPLTGSPDPSREAATNVALVGLNEVARRTAEKLGDDIDGGVSVSSRGQSDVVTVTATDTNPERAARHATTFALSYIEFRRDADRDKIAEAQRLVERQLEAMTPERRRGKEGERLRVQANELGILSSLQTGNAELVERAAVPGAPATPRTRRNVIVGGLLGLIFGLALAFLVERLDRRLSDPSEAEGLMQRPVLGAVPQSRGMATGSSSAAGLPPREAEVFRMLRANLRYFNVNRNIHTVLVTSAAPGDGKSTIAWNLAVAAADAGERVLLIEADLRHPSLSTKTQVIAPLGLSTVLSSQAEPPEAIQRIAIGPHRNNGDGSSPAVDVIFAGPPPPNPTDLLDSERMRALLKHGAQLYDYVIVDTPPLSFVSDAIPLLSEVDGVLVVARLGRTTRDQLSLLRNQLANLSAPLLGVVVNGVKSTAGYYGYGPGYEIAGPAAEPDREPVAV